MNLNGIKIGIKILLMAFLVVGSSALFMGATTTRTSSGGKVGDFTWIKFNSVNIAGTDTALYILPSPPDFPTKSSFLDTAFQLTVSTQSANGDSVDIGVRWQSSYDNTNWETVTLGTDSTSWVSTTTTTWDLNTTLFVNWSTIGGLKPYNRVQIVGLTGNAAGTAGDGYTAAKLDIIGFD